MRWLSWILLIPLGVAVIVFSVSNRSIIAVDFWPFGYAVDLPVFAVALSGLLLGFVLGGIVAWVGNAKTRHRARTAERAAADARRELATVRPDKPQGTPLGTPPNTPRLPG